MKAVGARKRDIVQLFLVEATILGVLGAVLGAVGGILGGYTGAALIGLPYRFNGAWLAAAVVVGVLVGVLSGLYPAWRAANTDPIDALRHG